VKCPECRDGKPWNCTGWTLTDDDEMVDCDQAPGLNAVGSEPAGSTPEHTNSGGRDERD